MKIDYCMSDDEHYAFFTGTAETGNKDGERVPCIYFLEQENGIVDEFLLFNHEIEWLQDALTSGTVDEYFAENVDYGELESDWEILNTFIPDEKGLRISLMKGTAE